MSVPSAPNIWVRPLGTLNQLEFWWQEPANNGGSAITYYQLTCPAIALIQNFSSNVFETRISSLQNEREYQFSLAAANIYGLGASSTFTSVQPGDKPKNNYINSITMIAPSTATLSWNFTYNQAEGDTKWFVISAIPSTPNLSTLQFTALSTATSSIMTYLSTDTYTVQVFAVNDSGWQYANKTPPIYVDTKIYDTLPVPAKNVLITSISTTSASISWVRGFYESYYNFYINNTLTQPANFSYAANTASFTNLTAASSYILTINSFNNVGITASNPIVLTTNTILPTNITNLLMVYRTASELSIQWTGGIGATSWSFSLNGITVQPFSVDLSRNLVKFTGLNPDAIYAVNVTATNLGGTVISPSSNFITLPNPPSVPANLLLPYIDNKGFSLSFIGGNSPVDVVSNFLFYVNQQVNIPSTSWYSSYTSGTSILVSTLSSYTLTTWESVMKPSTFVYPSPSSMWFSTLISTSSGSTFWYSTFSTISTVNSTYSSIVSLFASTTNISTFSTLSSVIGSTISTYIFKTGDEKVVQFNNLSSSTAYQLIVQASNTGGTVSSLSAWVSTLTAIPTKPVITSGISDGPYDISISWSDGIYATSFVFSLNGVSTTPATYNLTNKTATFTNLNYSTVYAVVVTAVNVSAAISSDAYNVTTPIAPPSQPVQLVESAITSSGFTISWSGGLLSSSYSFLVNGLVSTPASYSTLYKTVTFTGLLPLTSYIVVVIATNSSGTNESNPQTVTTLIAIPTQPTNIQTTALDYSYFSISWTGGDIASSFTFTLNGVTKLPTAHSISLKTATFSGLTASTAYAVIITAINSTGSTPSSPYTVTTTVAPPDYPLSISYSLKTYNSINLYWSGAARATDYSFTLNGTATAPSSYSVAGQTAVFNGLIAYNDCAIVVTAINVSGSTSSAPVVIKTRLAPPSQPQSLASNSITQTSFSISWAMPSQIPLIPTSNMATDFFFTLNGIAVTPSAYSISGFTASFTGLIAGTTYAVIVTSYNESGTNASSPLSVLLVPSTPSITSFGSITYSNFTVYYSGGNGATSFTYTLNGSSATPVSSSSGAATFSGLSASTTYSVIVTATNSSGSVSSSASSVTTAVAIPTAPSPVSSSSITNSGFTISWSGSSTATAYSFTLNGVPVTPSSLSVGGQTATFTGLATATEYIVVITASNVSGSASSSPHSVTTAGAPTLQVLTKTSLTASGYGCCFDAAGQNFYTCMYRPSEIWKVSYPGLVATRYASWDPGVASNLIGVTMDLAGNVYVTDNARHNLWKITAQDTSYLFGAGPSQCGQVGPDGYMWQAGNYQALKVSNTGTVTVITPSYIDGTTANFQSLTSTRMGPDGKVYIMDCNGQRIVRMDADGSNAITFIGNGTDGSADGTGTGATLSYPWDMCFDSAGNIYFGSVGETGNYIRKATPSGVVTTYAGTGSAGALDGPLRSATIQFNGITIGPDGNLWFTNNGGAIRIAQQATPLQPMPLYAFTNSPTTVPNQPTNVTMVSNTPNGFTITWANGDPSTSVDITLNGSSVTPAPLYLGGKTATFTGLTSGTSYDIIITGSNSAGSGPGSVPVSVSTAYALPNQPTSLASSSITTSGFTLTWSAGDVAASYTYTLNGLSATPSSQSVGSKTATFTGLTPGATYAVTVSAVNPAGSTASNPFNVTIGAAPTIPTNISGSAISAVGFTISWTGGVGATSYTFSLDGIATTPSSYSVSNKTAVFTGLTANTTYSVIVNAINSYGTTPSAGTNITTSNTPQAAINIIGSPISQTGFTLNWSGGAAATSYTFTFNGSAATPISSSVSNKTATFAGLTAGTTYAIIITSVNAFGTTPSSSTSIPTVPSQPINLTSSAITSSGFTISWSGGTGATTYTYTNDGSSISPSSDQGVASKTASFSGLSEGVTYNIVVNATNSSGSTSSSSISVTTTILPPPGVVIFSVPADYILITYEFSGGNDMDTRTRVSAPYTSPYLGWGQSYSDNRGILFFGGDNTGQGFEACYFDVTAFKNTGQAPDIQIECRAQWYGTSSTVPLKLGVTLFKGGSMQKSGYSWVNPSASNTTLLFSAGKSITLFSQSGGSTGQYIGTLYYNVNTGTGNVNVN